MRLRFFPVSFIMMKMAKNTAKDSVTGVVM
jgi:hypothetical protein